MEAETEENSPEVSGVRALIAERAKRAVHIGKRLLPWASLAAGVVGAFLMDRSPKSAWLIILMGVLGWAALIGFILVGRLDPERFEGKKRMLVMAAQLGALFLIQNVMQNCLLFALPFYVLAASFVPTHIAFIALLVSVTAVTMWDPLYEAVVGVHPFISFSLQGFATFFALNAVFPPLGLSNRMSLIVAGVITAVGVPLLAFIAAPVGDDEDTVRKRMLIRRGALITAGAAVVIVPIVVVFGGAAMIPPAPMRLMEGYVGTELVRSTWTASPTGSEALKSPSQLVCVTRIGAPRGIKDELFHVWRHNGHETDRIRLDVRVQSEKKGFATFSRKKRLGGKPEGRWTCTVETASGQLLGRISRVVE